MSNETVKVGQRVWVKIGDTTESGILVDINKRMATVDLENGMKPVKVGKTKVSQYEEAPAKQDFTNFKFDPDNAADYDCPHCGIGLDNGVTEDGIDGTNDSGHLFECMGCGDGFGPKTTRKKAKKSYPRNVNDEVSAMLADGNWYATAAGVLGRTQVSLKQKYGHLDAGRQRMCLGNLIRGHLKRNQ